ncbi:MAG: threonine/serine dehydratase, partial [Candidatus Hodarchaeota archaeon]
MNPSFDVNSITIDAIKEAHRVVVKYIKRTPIVHSEYLSELTGGEVYLKLENQQFTNSFKIRGALFRMSLLDSQAKERGVVTASSGNHAQAVALAAKHLNIDATIVVPRDISKAKLEKIKSFNVDIVLEGGYDEVEGYARKLAGTTGKTYISPYNDPSVIIGQGTLGLEVVEDLKNFDVIILPVGGGGLISGIAAAVKKLLPKSQ